MAETEVPAAQGQATLEFDQIDDYRQFLLYTRPEIVSVLRTLIQKHALITAYFDRGYSFLLTSLLALGPDGNELILDIGSDSDTNKRALLANKLTLSTAVDKVKVQFSIARMTATQFEGRPAFRAALPESLLRLQRREYFRLSMPAASPIKCSVNVQIPDGGTAVASVQLLDISGGGAGLLVPPDQTAWFGKGIALNNCKITLPDEGTIVASMVVRDVFDVTTRSGNRYLRAGCEFVGLPGAYLTMIQRYITRVERERKARLSGLA